MEIEIKKEDVVVYDKGGNADIDCIINFLNSATDVADCLSACRAHLGSDLAGIALLGIVSNITHDLWLSAAHILFNTGYIDSEDVALRLHDNKIWQVWKEDE